MISKNKFKLSTPILYLVFNRPNHVKKTFPEIRRARPKQLFIAADGPRTKEEKKKTDAIRKYILDNINWKCEVKTLFRDKNLGCKVAVSSAIDWFFDNVEEGIILEDDCLPSQSFFRFCQEMLSRYREDERVMHISGTNILGDGTKTSREYIFSECFNVWGWATWKRAWRKYDVHMKMWPKFKKNRDSYCLNIHNWFDRFRIFRIFELCYRRKIDTWDYQWDFACRINNGLSIIPSVNLITNIGISKEATHTTNYGSHKSLNRGELSFPISENRIIISSLRYNKLYSNFFKSGLFFRTLFRLLGKN